MQSLKVLCLSFAILLLHGSFTIAGAQDSGRSPDGLWEDIRERSVSGFKLFMSLDGPVTRAVRLDMDKLKTRMRAVRSSSSSLQTVTIPVPKGLQTSSRFITFRIEESPLMSASAANASPAIKTYRGVGVDDPTATIRFSITPNGFKALVLTSDGAFQVMPFYDVVSDIVPLRLTKSNSRTRSLEIAGKSKVSTKQKAADRGYGDLYISFFKRQAPGLSSRPVCRQPAQGTFLKRTNAPSQTPFQGFALPRRTFRLALAATAEYTARMDDGDASNGDQVEDALYWMVETLNQVQAVYEREFNVGFVLVDREREFIFTDPAADGYTNGDTLRLIEENQSKLDGELTDAGYDIGHLFSTEGGGRGDLASTCISKRKGKGVSGSPDPFGPEFDIDYVAHELGHQFGANHTFNGINFKTDGSPGACSADSTDAAGNTIFGTRNPVTAFEPGSGSTIMSYGGICGSENVVAPPVDSFFHTVNLFEIYYHLEDTALCGLTENSANLPPEVNAGSDFTIPRETPFALTAAGSDPDGDTVLYSWEEMYFDDWFAGRWAPATGPPNDDSDGSIRPVFRAFLPTTNPTRIFPDLGFIRDGKKGFPQSLLTLAKTPAGERTLTFRATARDGNGGFGFDDVNVRVVGKSGGQTIGPLVVTRPLTAAILRPGRSYEVKWDAANTDLPPVNCRRVRITLSVGGGDFNIVLLDNTPNDGVESVTIPANTPAGDARIKIEAVDNIFFNVSGSFRLIRN